MRLSATEAGCGGQPAETRRAPAALCLGLVGYPLVRLKALDRRDHPAPVLAALLLFALQVLEEPRLHDDAAHLHRDGAQEADLVAREAPPAERLHDQDTDRRAALDDRDAQERVILLLARLREELVARMG